MSASVSTAARIVRLLWRGARAVRAVERGVDFSQGVVTEASELADEIRASGGGSLSDAELAEELERRGVSFRSQDRRPTARDFMDGPTETREEHYADRGAPGGPTTGPTPASLSGRSRRR